MTNTGDSWTKAHDLALLFISAAYGGKRRLTDREIDRVVEAVGPWNDQHMSARNVVLEAWLVYAEEGAAGEVLGHLAALEQTLSQEEQDEALQALLWVAEVDPGVRTKDHTLLEALSRLLCAEVRALERAEDYEGAWTSFHDLALLYLMIAQGGRHVPCRKELGEVEQKLSAWAVESAWIDQEKILSDVLAASEQETAAMLLQRSVSRLRIALGGFQRLALIADLSEHARCDGVLRPEASQLIASLATSWDLRPTLRPAALT